MYKATLDGSKRADGLGDAILLPHLFSLGCDGTLYASSPSSAIVLRLPVGTEKFEVHAGIEGKKGGADGKDDATFSGPQGLEAWDDVGGRLWVADAPAHTLRLVLGSEIRTVAGKYGVKGSVDGKARFLGSDVAPPVARGPSSSTSPTLSPTRHRALSYADPFPSSRSSFPDQQDAPLALLDSPQFVLRLRSRHALIIAETNNKKLRMLDLDHWTVTTLHLSGETLPYFSLWSVPSLAQHFDDREFLKVQSYSTGVRPFHIDLSTGAVSHLDAKSDHQAINETTSDSISSSSSSSSLTSEFGNSWESSSSLTDLMASSIPSSPREAQLNRMPITSSDDFPMAASYTLGSFFVNLDAGNDTVYSKDFYMSQPFAFVPHSNSLLYCSGSGVYSIKTNFLSPHPPYPRSMPNSPRHLRRAPILRRPQLTRLLETPDLVTDFILENAATKAKWNLHTQILLFHPGLKLEKLKSLIQETIVPAASIGSFLRYLYFEQIPDGYGKDFCIMMSHFIHLASSIGIEASSRLSIDFSASVMSLSDQERCEALIQVWEDDFWQEEDYVVQDLISGIDLELFKEILPTSGLSIDKLASLAMLVASPCDVPSLSEGELYEAPGLPSIPIFSVPTPVDPSILLIYSSDFIFVSKESRSKSFSIRTSAIHMYPQWRWFRRLLKFNSAAAKTRVIHLPLSMNVIKAILETLHCDIRTELNEEESMVLLENAQLLGLVSATNEPIAPFIQAIRRAKDLIFPAATSTNRLLLLERCKRLRNFELANSILGDLLVSNSPLLFRDLAQVIDIDLVLLMQARSRGHGSFWVEADTSKFKS